MASFFRLIVEIHVLQKTSDMNETKFCKSFKNTEDNDNATGSFEVLCSSIIICNEWVLSLQSVDLIFWGQVVVQVMYMY